MDSIDAHICGTFGDEAACTIDTSWVELDEFEILQRKARPSDHGISITRARVRASATEVCASVASGGKNSLVGAETVKSTVFHVQRDNTNTFAILHDEIQREVFNEEVRVVSEGLAVERVQEGVSGTIGGGSATVRLTTLSEIQRLTTKSALVDLALLRPRERNTKVLELAGMRLNW